MNQPRAPASTPGDLFAGETQVVHSAATAVETKDLKAKGPLTSSLGRGQRPLLHDCGAVSRRSTAIHSAFDTRSGAGVGFPVNRPDDRGLATDEGLQGFDLLELLAAGPAMEGHIRGGNACRGPGRPLDRVQPGRRVGQEALGHRLAGHEQVAEPLVGQGAERDQERQRLVRPRPRTPASCKWPGRGRRSAYAPSAILSENRRPVLRLGRPVEISPLEQEAVEADRAGACRECKGSLARPWLVPRASRSRLTCPGAMPSGGWFLNQSCQPRARRSAAADHSEVETSAPIGPLRIGLAAERKQVAERIVIPPCFCRDE